MENVTVRISFLLLLLLLLLLFAVLPACSVNPSLDNPHVLVGKIVDAGTEDEISFSDLLARASGSDVIYLGESHDNADHHRSQHRMISALIESGSRPAIGFEFFGVGQTGYLEQYVHGSHSFMKSSKKSNIAVGQDLLRRRLGWAERSDRDWNYYFQLIELAREHGLPVFGADLPAAIKLRLSRVGLPGLNSIERSQLVNIGFEDPAYRELMYNRFRASHCGWGNESMLARLYETWLARNARMAISVVEMKRGHEGPVVLILGTGHIEYDQGVPERVRALAPEFSQLNLSWREVYSESIELSDYLVGETVAGRDFTPRNQVFWFTEPRYNRPNPCAGFVKHSK